MQTRSQRHSSAAYHHVVQAKAERAIDTGKYRTNCQKMPSLLHQSGLLQALVFMAARDTHGERFVDDLAAALRPEHTHKELIREAQQATLPEYVHLTDEIAELSQWFRRFAQIELGEEAE
jgi:CRISPR/Cas system CMR-associated protein Cmr5 small subunit